MSFLFSSLALSLLLKPSTIVFTVTLVVGAGGYQLPGKYRSLEELSPLSLGALKAKRHLFEYKGNGYNEDHETIAQPVVSYLDKTHIFSIC